MIWNLPNVLAIFTNFDGNPTKNYIYQNIQIILRNFNKLIQEEGES